MQRFIHVAGLMLAIVLAVVSRSGASAPIQGDPGFGKPYIDSVKGAVKLLALVKVVNFGKAVYHGPINVNVTLNRIRAGNALGHKNDGAIFMNREGRLPVQKDKDYYCEFVHWDQKLNAQFDEKISFPGPLRVILGKKGEVFFTADHYHSFTRVN